MHQTTTTQSTARPAARLSKKRNRGRLIHRAAFASASLATFIAQVSLATTYPDKHGNAGDITLDAPIVQSVFGEIDYAVPYTVTDSEGTKSGEYYITSEQLPGRDLTPTNDSVLRLFVTDSESETAAELVFRNNPNVAPAMPVLTLFDCQFGECVEATRYDDPQSGCWVISEQYDIENYPIELLDARVILGLLDDAQLLDLPNSVDGTGNWDEIMLHHRINFEESKFRGDIDHLGDEQSDLLTGRMIAEIESHNDCTYDDWLVRHWCTEAECPEDVGIQHGALSFMTEHTTLIEAMSETLFSKHLNDWPVTGDPAAFAFPFGRMPMWKVDADHEHGSGTPCTPDGPSENCHMLPPYWDRVIDGYGRAAPGVCETTKLPPLAIPGCYHDFPIASYVPTLTPTDGAETGPGETNNLGQAECAEVVGPDGFVDRPCTDPADYVGAARVAEDVYHNPLHGFIGGAFASPPTTAGTMVFWTFHTQVSSNALANWRHAQKRDVGVAQSSCSAEGYEAEDMFQSTGGAVTDGWNIWSNGYVSTLHTFTPGPSQVTVIARGQQAFNVWPHMVVSVDGVEIGDVDVTTADWASYSFPFNAMAGEQEIRVEFDNDAFQPPSDDRNLLVDALFVDCTEPASGNPCAAFCEDPEQISWSGSYQSANLGAGTTCRETTQEIAGGVCGNFTAGKQLYVNGTAVTCDNQNWSSVPAPVNGGYCLQSSAGEYPWSYYALW